MPSERIQKQIELLLNQAESAIQKSDWVLAMDRSRNVLALDPDNSDAKSYLIAAERALSASESTKLHVSETEKAAAPTLPSSIPTSFASGRYKVSKFLGEGGKKKVYLAHDTVLDRDVAFALIKTEKLDETARTRIRREAQAMGKLGDHPNIMSIFDFGDHEGQPFIVIPLMAGGDVEGLIKKAPDHKLPIDKAVEITRSVCKGLEFAHSKGIIHRDIKPGNIWIGADGTVKIGDFGLAVAIDLSRLTQDGMMVGTVSYMPPEQAMGGQVTAKADLYSLGAMLYEMVTGRPPFIGDDSVAIIGQHINTPPVSPMWHRADLPAALESLIMLLLEKDPNKRPASAKDVSRVLESIEKGKVKEATVITKAPAENPLYRRIFVGRENEIKQLQTAFDGAISGQGALVMVVGEPGIGKTAICDQLSTYVTLRGGKTLTGNCYEEGSLSLPYLAFVEAMRSYVLDRDQDDLKKELGSGATDVARIVSEIREKLHVEPRQAENPEEDRYRLMQAVTSFLKNAASVKPMLLILEDLHDADKGTLEMLEHVSRNLAGTRLMIVGTYRDVEVDRNHPLSASLAELRRISSFGRVLLRGLNIDEVRHMLANITRAEIPLGLADAVHRQTEGNPLFIQEVVRYLAEEGLIKQEEGKWRPAKDTPLEMNIPEGLRDVIGKRLTLLSKECNQLLSVAAVIGREFSLDTLRLVTSIDEEIFIKALKEAVQTAVLEERKQVGSIHYRFTHAFFRQTLYEEMIAPQRLRLHQQVARALEQQYARRLDEHAAELADHYSQSTDSADLEKAVKYSEMAAKRAGSVYAYSEAVRLLDQAIKVQEILDPDNKVKRCDLLLDLCDSLIYVPDFKRIIEVEGPAAFSLAESIGEDSRAARAAHTIETIIPVQEGQSAYYKPERIKWIERLDRYAQPETVERIYADVALGGIKRNIEKDFQSYKRLYKQAADNSRRLGYREVLLQILGGQLNLSRPQDHAEYIPLAEEMLMLLQHSVSKDEGYVSNALISVGGYFLESGLRQRAEEAWNELRELVGRTGSIFFELCSLGMDSILAVLDGHLEQTVELSERLKVSSEEAKWGLGMVVVRCGGLRAQIYLGVSPEELERWHPGYWNQDTWGKPRHCLMHAHLGRYEEASALLDSQVVNRNNINTDEDETAFWVDAFYLEASVITGHRRAAELLLKRMDVPGLYTSGWTAPTCIQRHLGGAAALLERYDEARKYYKEAIRICTEMKFRPELALSRLQLAELLLEHYPNEKKQALEHLDFAIKEFQEMKMKPSLERALRHKEILKA